MPRRRSARRWRSIARGSTSDAGPRARAVSAGAKGVESDSIVSVYMAVLAMTVITPVPLIGVCAIGVATDSWGQRTGRGLAETVRARWRVRAVVWQALRARSGCCEDDQRQRQNEF